MYMPSACWVAVSTVRSPSGPRTSPLDAMRRRPRLSCSSRSQISFDGTPSAWRRARSTRNASTNAVSTQRVAWPGAVSSRAVVCARSAASWKPGRMAPVDTASSVNRYAVPISTPTPPPMASHAPDIAATIAAERPSCTPPANSARTDGGSLNASSRASCCSHRTNDDRGPTWPPHSLPSNTNRRAPSARKASSSAGDGQCRYAGVPASSNARAWDGRPPAISANGGRTRAIASSWGPRTSGGANPRMPAPQGRSPQAAAVSCSRASA